MDATELYRQILGICAPWYVDGVELDHRGAKVTVQLEHQAEGFCCPKCGVAVSVYDHAEARTWRHLDTCQFETLLTARVPRVKCARCGVLTATIPWAAPHGRFTLLFECFALDVLFAVQVQSRAAELLRLSDDQVRWLQRRAVERGLRRRDPERPRPHVMMDEKSLHTGHHYVTILSDGTHGEVLDVVEHRTTEAAAELFGEALSESQKATVKAVSVDMWARSRRPPKPIFPLPNWCTTGFT